MRKYTTLLFDADMTLFDFDGAERAAFGIVMGAHGIQYSEADFSRYHAINAALWERFGRGEITKTALQSERFNQFFATLGDAYRHVDGGAVNAAYVDALAGCSKLLDGAEELCRRLHGMFDMYIVTNGVSRTQKKRFAASAIKQYFGGLFISEDAGEPKPSPVYFDYVFAHIGEERRAHSVIIGDSLTSDIAGGMNAGIDTIWYNPKHLSNTTDYIPTCTVDSYDALYALLTSQN